MSDVNSVSIKSFIDEINVYNLESNLSKLNSSDKEFIALCTDIIKSNFQKVPSGFTLNNEEFNALTKSIIYKLLDFKDGSTHSKVNEKAKDLFKGSISNSEVLAKVKEATSNTEEFTHLLQALKEFKGNHPGQRVDFAEFLHQQGWPSTDLSNINFRQLSLFLTPISKAGTPPYWGTDLFKNVDFKNIHFKDCDLEYLNFSGSTFEGCSFENCNLKNAVLCETIFRNTSFNNAYLQDALFDGSELRDVRFGSAQLEYANFYDCRLEGVDFQSCEMTGTNFFEAQVDEGKSCRLTDCDLTNCLLFEAKKHFAISGGTPHIVTKPVVVLPWNNHKPGLMATRTNRSLKHADSIPVKFHYFPSKIDTTLLGDQVKEQMEYIKNHPEEEKLSIPEAILRRTMATEESRIDNSEIYKLVSHAAKLAKATDAMMLPGGSDIEPEFYGQEKAKETVTDPDYRRSLFEFALIREAREKGLPLMGICRGSQLGNIFYGGTLQQHIEGHKFKIQAFQFLPVEEGQAKGIIRGLAKKGKLEGYSEHHQAIDQIGEGLEKVAVFQRKIETTQNGKKIVTMQETTKALEGKKGAPLILTQFHPEYFADSEPNKDSANFAFSSENKAFMSAFTGEAARHRQKQIVGEDVKQFAAEGKKLRVTPAPTPIEPQKQKSVKVEPEPVLTFAQKIQNFASKVLNSIKSFFSSISQTFASWGSKKAKAVKSATTSPSSPISSVNDIAVPVIKNTIDAHALLEGKEEIAPSQFAWHLNLGLLRSAYNDTKDPKVKRQIEFLINNYLDKSAPMRSKATKELVKDFEGNYQAHPQSDYLYYRTEFLKKLELTAPFNKDLALADKSPLILTDTDELDHLFPISFHVMNEQAGEKEWGQAMAQVLAKHFDKNGIKKGLEGTLHGGILFDLTSQLAANIRTNGSQEKEEQFVQQLNEFKEKLNMAIDEAVDRLADQYPELREDEEARNKVKAYLKKNITALSRLKVNENMGGIKVLPLFTDKLDGKTLEKDHEEFVEFLNHTGTILGAVNMRRYVMNAHESRPDIHYAVQGDNALYFKKKTDLADMALMKRLTKKFASSELMKENPHLAILGQSTMQLVNGMMAQISEDKWRTLNADHATRKIIQTTLYQLKERLAMAEFQMNDFPKFAQEIELAHAEMATLLELFRPYEEKDFPKIFKEQLKAIVPENLQASVQTGVGKTAVNLFAGMNAALLKQNPEAVRCYSKGLYYEQAFTMGHDYTFEEMMKDETVKAVDFYACQTNPNIEIGATHHHYEKVDIASDIQQILEKNRKSAAKVPLTVAVDCTIEYLKSEEVKALLAKFQEEIKAGELNLVFFHSGQKFDMLGMDNYYGSPFFMVNNGSSQWTPFNGLLRNPVHKTDPLSQQWFCLSNQYAADTIDQYRKQIFDNTKDLIKKIPQRLQPTQPGTQKVWVSTFDDKIEPSFIDIKFVGKGHRAKAKDMIKKFYQKCDEHDVKAFRRPSFGFYHPNITLLDTESDVTSLRINPGLNPKETAVLVEYLEELAKSL
ncbi:gamma-glutamyl-gamma-aminobutyrate hydrolase family protein [Candidatus Protochlamydia phocaeensis]|uniref:gamma-glutamyl-gamma-aminobutyrate hydrolase family protein n=1 Tax=Candidatus Protochlamydia phocaeensis TaxID=1414722 RepID=UPI000838DD01|nr:gamma-glutamyl-gamma-aminobutyrate hydrolase family protein [Candidatus Protochlamydia phocaeensis]